LSGPPVSWITLDVVDGKMYWAHFGMTDGVIRRANLDGSGQEDIVLAIRRSRRPIRPVASLAPSRSRSSCQTERSCSAGCRGRRDARAKEAVRVRRQANSTAGPASPSQRAIYEEGRQKKGSRCVRSGRARRYPLRDSWRRSKDAEAHSFVREIETLIHFR
jgi:hypothetical protein